MAPLPWRPHLAQLVLHAGPDAAQVDGGHAVEALGRLLGEVAGETDDAGVVERHVQPTIGGDGALDHGGGLRLVRHIAGDADRLATGRGQRIGRGVEGVGVDVGKHDRGARLSERLRGGQPDARTGTGDQGDLAAKS